jgi:CspA family cold shock protein
MKTGVVKFFNDAKGFGFIKVDGGGEDLFVHSSGLKTPVRENDKVQFDVQEGKKGLNAINVSVVK